MFAALLACAPPDAAPDGRPEVPSPGEHTGASDPRDADLPPNVLLVLLDDVGTDKIQAYGESPTAPPTPTISALAAEGVLFRNAWASPICGPSRGMLLTGRWERRYGFGQNVDTRPPFRLPDHERMIPGWLADAPVPYTSYGAGKWHVTGADTPDFMLDPLQRGFARYVGPPGNVNSYFEWYTAIDGEILPRDGYLTTETADDALLALAELSEPWFLYLSFNAPHAPSHVPPPEIELLGVEWSDDRVAKYDAALAAVDAELGRVLDGMDPEVRARTVIVVMGDNGTPDFAITPPFLPSHGKQTLFEGGINVPLVVTGPVVEAQGAESRALVSIVDVAATVVEIAGVDPRSLPLDGTSFLPQLRDPAAPGPRFAYTEYLRANGPPPWEKESLAIRDERYKLVRYGAFEGLFDLEDRHDDGPELMLQGPLDDAAAAALDELRAEVARIAADVPYEGP